MLQWMLYVWLALFFPTSVMFLAETLYCKSSNIFNLTVSTYKIHHHSTDISDKIPKILQVDWMRNIWSSWKALLTYLKGFVSKATFWEIWFVLFKYTFSILLSYWTRTFPDLLWTNLIIVFKDSCDDYIVNIMITRWKEKIKIILSACVVTSTYMLVNIY